MLQEWKAMEKPDEEEIKARLAAAKEKLAKQQLLIKEHKIPVLVLMEGWGTAGKGSVIGQVIQNIDPRFFKVESMGEKSEEERRKPFLYRYFKRIPEEGKFVFLDSGWMDEIVKDELHGKLSDEDYTYFGNQMSILIQNAFYHFQNCRFIINCQYFCHSFPRFMLILPVVGNMNNCIATR